MSTAPDQVQAAMRLLAEKKAGKVIPFRKVICETCEDRGYVAGQPCSCELGQRDKAREERLQQQAKEAARVAADAAAERRMEKVRQKLEKAGGFVVPEKYKEFSPDTLKAQYGEAICVQKKFAWLAVKDWVNGTLEKSGLLLTGDPGTGKTAAVIWAADRRCKRTGEAALLIRYADFIGAIQSTYSQNGHSIGATKRELILAAQTAPALVLDDFGEISLELGKAASNDKQSIMLEVLDYRTQHDLPTLIVTNLTQARLMAQFNGAIIGRLMELCLLVEMNGADLRQKGARGWQ